MFAKIKVLITVALLFMCHCFLHGQSIHGDIKAPELQLNLVKDTLLSNKGDSIYVGKLLTVGKGSGENGRYEAISFKSATAFPLLLFRNSETKSNPEYQADPSARDADKVKDYLAPGQLLEVTKIKSKGGGKNWHYYQVFLSGAGAKFKCDIAYALALKELLSKP